MPKAHLWATVTMTLTMLVGCEANDPRLARLAEESVQMQAEQNKQVALQHHEIAQASRQLIEADAQARAEFQGMSQHLDQQRIDIHELQAELNQERRQLIQAEQRAPLIASAIGQVGVLIASLLPLLLCVYVLRVISASSATEDSVALNDLLVLDATSAQPTLFSPPVDLPLLTQLDAGQNPTNSQG